MDRRPLRHISTTLRLAVAGSLLWQASAGCGHDQSLSPLPPGRLCWAAGRGDVRDVADILARGGDVAARTTISLTDASGRVDELHEATALHCAAFAGSKDVVRLLINHKAPLDVQTSRGSTPLKIACRPESESVVPLLIAAGASPNISDDRGWSPLASSVSVGSVGTVRALLSAGADPNARTNDGTTPLMLAANANLPRGALIAALRSRGKTVEGPAVRATQTESAPGGYADKVAALLAHGARPDMSDAEGMTPLFCASLVGSLRVAQMLIDHGADVNWRDKLGESPLEIAAGGSQREIVRLLLRRGAKAGLRDVMGRTALWYATDPVVRKLLLDAAKGRR